MSCVPTQSKTDTSVIKIQNINPKHSRFRTYARTDLDNAVTEYLNGVDMKEIRIRYPNIPERTVYGRAFRKRNRVKAKKPGPAPTLVPSQEKILAEWIISQQLKGERITRDMVRKKGYEILHAANSESTEENDGEMPDGGPPQNETDYNSTSNASPDNSPTNKRLGLGWFNRFMRRHSNLSLRRPHTRTSPSLQTSSSSNSNPQTSHATSGSSSATVQSAKLTESSLGNMENGDGNDQSELSPSARHRSSRKKRKQRYFKSSRSPSPNDASPKSTTSRDNNSHNLGSSRTNTATSNRRHKAKYPLRSMPEMNSSHSALSPAGYSYVNPLRWLGGSSLDQMRPTSEYEKLEMEKLRYEVEERRLRVCVQRALARKSLLEAGMTPEEADAAIMEEMERNHNM